MLGLMGATKDSVFRSAFVITAVFFIDSRNFLDTFRTKRWAKIERRFLLGFEPGVFVKLETCTFIK